jgi:outer membrane receptor protein involved in Fe transport
MRVVGNAGSTSAVIGVALFVFSVIPAVKAGAAGQDIYRLGEVVVSAPRLGVEATGTVHSVTAEEIAARGARTLDQALALVPGLTMRTANAGSPRIDIRGLRTRHVLLLLDGIPINSTFDGQFDPSTIGVENIASIKVTTGGASVLYGAGGNGGVINIITKKGQQGVHGQIGAEAGENDAYLERFTLSAGTSNVDAFVSGSIYDQDSFRLSDDFTPTADEDGGDRLASDRSRRNLFANVNWSPTDKTLLGLNLQYRKDEFGIPPITNASSTDPFSKNIKFDRIDDLEGIATQLAFDQQLSGPFSSRGWLYFNRLNLLENRYDDAIYSTQTANGATRSDSTTDNAGVNLQFKGNWQNYGVTTLALLAENSNWVADGFQVTTVTSGGGGGGGGGSSTVTTPFDQQRDLQHYTAALQYELEPLPSLGLVLGLGGHLQRQDDGDTSHSGSYQLGLHYDLFAGTQLRANHARKIHFPSISQLYDVTSGNEGLKAERTLHYEIGVNQQLPAATNLDLDGFMIDAKDFIEKNDFTNRYENFEEYRFQGVELALENRFVAHLLLRASYSYLYSENRSAGSTIQELQYRPKNKVTLEGRYDFTFGLSVNASLLYVGHQYFLDKTATLKQRLNDYTLVNLKLSQDLLAKRLNLYLGADNLFDEDYEQSYGLPQAGRTLYAGMEYRF